MAGETPRLRFYLPTPTRTRQPITVVRRFYSTHPIYPPLLCHHTTYLPSSPPSSVSGQGTASLVRGPPLLDDGVTPRLLPSIYADQTPLLQEAVRVGQMSDRKVAKVGQAWPHAQNVTNPTQSYIGSTHSLPVHLVFTNLIKVAGTTIRGTTYSRILRPLGPSAHSTVPYLPLRRKRAGEVLPSPPWSLSSSWGWPMSASPP